MKRTIAAGVAIVAIAAPASASAANCGHGIKTQGIPARVSVPGLDQKLKLVHKQIPRCVLAREVKARASGLRVAANPPGKPTTIATDVNGPGGWDGGDWRARQWWGDIGDLPTVFGVARQGRKSVQWTDVQRQG